jgi:hypothetical protein
MRDGYMVPNLAPKEEHRAQMEYRNNELCARVADNVTPTYVQQNQLPIAAT